MTPTLNFAPQQTFTTGASPVSVVVADFDLDGRADLAVANATDSTVSVFRNITPSETYLPTFAVKQDFATGTTPYGLTAADFDLDGRPDLAVVNNASNSVSVLKNTTLAGASTLTFAVKQDFATGTNPFGVTAADFDLDGRPDLAVVNNANNTVSVFKNNTLFGAVGPTFAAKQDFATGTNPFDVIAADFDGDGRADLAVTAYGGSAVSVFRNTTAAGASPSFVAKQDFATGLNPYGVTAADFDLDGRPDLVVANNGSNTVSVLRNTTPVGASPTFAVKQDFATGTNPFGVTVADFDGDGRTDLAVACNTSSAVSVLRNTTAAGASPSFAAKQDFATGANPAWLTTSDFDLDGRVDLAVAAVGSNSVSVVQNSSTGGVVSGLGLTGQFGNTGVWRFNLTANTWGQLTGANANSLAVAANGNVVASFGGNGVYYYRAATNLWTKLHNNQAVVAIDRLGNAYANFPGFGTYLYRLATGTWAKLGVTAASADQLAVSANGDVIANFTTFGVFRFRSTGADWVLLNGVDATTLAVDANGYVIASFARFGVGRYIPFAAGWQLLTPAGATAVAADGSGNVYAAFAGYGLGRRLSQNGTWTNVGPGAAATSLAADWFGNVAAAVPGFGVAAYRPFIGWFNLRPDDATLLRGNY